MNEEIKAKLLEQVGDVAEMTKDGIMKAVEVMQEQCPLLVEEVMAWEFFYSLAGFLFGVIGTVAVVLTVTYAVKHFGKKWKDDMMNSGCEWFSCFGLFLLLFTVPFFTCLTWIKIWIAPRLFLLEYISDLVK